MIRLNEFKIHRLDRKMMALVNGGFMTYTKNPETNSTVDTCGNGEFCDASGCVPDTDYCA